MRSSLTICIGPNVISRSLFAVRTDGVKAEVGHRAPAVMRNRNRLRSIIVVFIVAPFASFC